MSGLRWREVVPAPTLGAAGWVAGVAGATAVLPAGRAAVVAGTIALLVGGLGCALAAVVRPALPLLVAAAVLFGVARAALPLASPPPLAQAHALAGADVVLRGTVTDDPRLAGQGEELLVEPSAILARAGPLRPAGAVMILVRSPGDAEIGDTVEVGGRLQLPRQAPDFDRRAYLLQQGVTLELSAAHVNVVSHAGGIRAFPGWLRDRYRRAIGALLPPPHAAVLVGIVLGVRSGIPSGLDRALIATGLVHLLVLSGLKVAVFTRLVVSALQPVLGRLAALPAMALIALYALSGGATPAAMRAAAMGGLTLFAGWLGRPAHVWTSLAWTAAAMLAWRPDMAWNIGFQLSFAGTAAIIVLTPAIERRLHRVPKVLREPFAVTLAAQVGTLPMTAAGFQVLSPVAPVANALTLPLLPAVVGFGLLLAPLAMVPDIGRMVALPLAGVLAYVEQVATLLARVPGAALTVPAFPAWAGIAYYSTLLGGFAAWRGRGTLRRLAAAAAVAAPLLVGGAELVAWTRPPPSAAVLAVGDGEAVLVSGPEGAFLVGSGPSPAKLAAEVGGRLPPWRRRLDAIVIDGSSVGQVGGLAGSGVQAANVFVPDATLPGTAWRSAAVAQVAAGARLARVAAGDRIRIAGFEVEVLAPERGASSAGATDLALRIHRPGGSAICTTGDLDAQAQAVAGARLAGRCDTLVLPSQGRSAPAPELLAAARAKQLVASLGTGRLARGLPAGALRRTDQEGTIVVDLSG